jgi:hypothetical protein
MAFLESPIGNGVGTSPFPEPEGADFVCFDPGRGSFPKEGCHFREGMVLVLGKGWKTYCGQEHQRHLTPIQPKPGISIGYQSRGPWPGRGAGMSELGESHVIPRDSPGKLNLIAWLVEMCDIQK